MIINVLGHHKTIRVYLAIYFYRMNIRYTDGHVTHSLICPSILMKLTYHAVRFLYTTAINVNLL